MSKFKQTPHGSLYVKSTDSFTEAVYTLKLYIRAAAAATSLKYDPKSTIAIMNLCRELSGGNFKDFLIENFNNGFARRADLVTSIVRYLNGEVTNRAVTTQLKIGENEFLQRVSKDLNFTHTVSEMHTAALPKGMEQVTNRDFYRLIECMGPVKVARLFLMLSGDTYHVIRQ
ncbi:virion structural protein [Shewanella phage FishSpeaker]|nr:virion structural protein [Shewanella phage FishSpeaker]